jgi:hypothetical protein
LADEDLAVNSLDDDDDDCTDCNLADGHLEGDGFVDDPLGDSLPDDDVVAVDGGFRDRVRLFRCGRFVGGSIHFVIGVSVAVF